MDHIDPDAFERLGMRWMAGEAEHLLQELKKSNLEASEVRRVVENYLFGLTCRLDGSEPGTDAELCFAQADVLIRSGGKVDLHEAVLGVIDEVIR